MTLSPSSSNNISSSNYIYIADTSFLIKVKDDYPKDIFITLWNRIESLILNDRMKAPLHVYNEIKRKDDELTRFVDSKNIKHKLFIDNRSHEAIAMYKYAYEIVRDYPALIHSQKPQTNPVDPADPYVIGLALYYGNVQTLSPRIPAIVTEDKRDRGRKLSIITVCKEYNDRQGRQILHALDTIGLFKQENWRF